MVGPLSFWCGYQIRAGVAQQEEWANEIGFHERANDLYRVLRTAQLFIRVGGKGSLKTSEPAFAAALDCRDNQFANRGRQMVLLPAPFIVDRSLSHFNRLQGIKRGAKRVIGHVRRGHGVTGSARSRDRRSVFHFPRGRVRSPGSSLRVAGPDFA